LGDPAPDPLAGRRRSDRLVKVSYRELLVPDPDGPMAGSPAQARLTAKTSSGRTSTVTIPPSELGSPKNVLKKVIDAIGVPPAPADKDALIEQITALQHANPIEVCGTHLTGWRDLDVNGRSPSFVLPGRTITDERPPRYELDLSGGRSNPRVMNAPGQVRGTLKGWRKRVAKPLGRSSSGIAALGAAMAAQLLRRSDLSEAMTLLISGPSRTGKSTIQLAALSFQGRADRSMLQSPSVTDAAKQEFGAAFNDLLLPIDDFSRLSSPTEQAELLTALTYELPAGGGRAVSGAMTAKGFYAKTFSTIVIATSEKCSSEILGRAKVVRSGGELARLLDVRVDGKAGVFDFSLARDRPLKRSGRKMAETLEAVAANEHFGTPLIVWIDWNQAQEAGDLKRRLKVLQREFETAVRKARPGRNDVESRANPKFALLYAALRLGREAGVIPWGRARVRLGLLKCIDGHLSSLQEGEKSIALLIERFRGLLSDPSRCRTMSDLKRMEKQASSEKAKAVAANLVALRD
jgi:hypothetical protein